MKHDLLDIVTRLIEIAWRRRMLLLLPILIMVPLSILGSRLMPQTYMARALLAMQEQGSDNPLIKSGTSQERIRDRAPGLQALLKSDRVLVGSLRDMLGDRMPTDSRSVALAVDDLDRALSFEMIGGDFLELQLKGNQKVGLGRKLEAVTARFLETLVGSDQDSLSAMQVLVEKRKEDVANAEKALQRFKDQLGERVVAAIAASETRLAQLQSAAQSMTSEIAAIDGQIATTSSALGPFASPDKAGQREEDIRAATAAAEAAAQVQTAASQVEAEVARGRAAQLTQLQELEIRGAGLRRDLAQTKTDIADMTKSASDTRSPEGQLRRLEREVGEARSLMESYAKRFPMTLSSRSLQVLNAPERIRVIDAPHDPQFPTASRLKIVIGGTLVGILLSLALVAVAEVFDQRLRHAADFEAAAGVPVLARLPSAKPDPEGEMGVETNDSYATAAGANTTDTDAAAPTVARIGRRTAA